MREFFLIPSEFEPRRLEFGADMHPMAELIAEVDMATMAEVCRDLRLVETWLPWSTTPIRGVDPLGICHIRARGARDAKAVVEEAAVRLGSRELWRIVEALRQVESGEFVLMHHGV